MHILVLNGRWDPITIYGESEPGLLFTDEGSTILVIYYLCPPKFAILWPDTGFKKCNGKWVEKVGGMWVLLLKY